MDGKNDGHMHISIMSGYRSATTARTIACYIVVESVANKFFLIKIM